MTIRIGIVAFEDAEELDFVGPWEVFTMGSQVEPNVHEVLLVAEKDAPVRCAKGLRVLPDVTFANCPPLDVLLIPGGIGTRREVENPVMLEWIAKVAPTCRFVTSVCTGAMLLTAAGPAKAKRVTTHWAFVEALRARKEAAEVVDNMRYVRDGNVVTAAGVSAGIDMALWLSGELHTPQFARNVQRAMEYDPAPPYTASV
ncbi:MAG TPA: DJ-1/PfpI family protein [Rhizomicrobium sp.]|nr:DJ-1/PfpI family protein [Rhizomicrobium sp.]